MNKPSKFAAIGAFLAVLVALTVAGTKVSRLTKTRTGPANSLFYIVTNAGPDGSRAIEATNLVTFLSGLPNWPSTNGGGGSGSATNAILITSGTGTNTSLGNPSFIGHVTNKAIVHYEGAYIEPRWTNHGARPTWVDSNDVAVVTLRTDGARIMYFGDQDNPATGYPHKHFVTFSDYDAALTNSFAFIFGDNNAWKLFEQRITDYADNNIISNNLAHSILAFGNTNEPVSAYGSRMSVIAPVGIGLSGQVTATNAITVNGAETNNADLYVRRLIDVRGTNLQPSVFITGYSNQYPQLLFQRNEDIEAAPTKVVAGDQIGNLEFLGYGGSTYRSSFSVRPFALTDFGNSTAETLAMFKIGNNSGSARDVWGLSAYNFTNNVDTYFNSNVVFNLGTRFNKGANFPTLSINQVTSLNSSGDLTNSPLRLASSFASLIDGQFLSYNAAMSSWTNTTVSIGIPNNSITYAQIQDITTSKRVLGRNTAGAGDPEEVGISPILDWIDTTRGDILFRNANSWTNLGPGAVGQFLQSGGAGADVSWVTPGTLTDGNKTDITVSGSGGTWTVNPQAISNSKFRDSSGLSVVGRSANSSGSVADMVAAADGQVVRRSGTTVGFGAVDLTSPNAISGVAPRVNLPTTVAYEDEANTFNVQQTFTGPFATTASNIVSTDIDWSLANFRKKTLTSDTVFTFSNLADDRWLRVKVTQNGTGGWTNAWPSGIVWINSTNQSSAPLVASGANAVTYMTFHRENGTIYGWQSGPDSIALTDLANITGLTKGDLFVWSGTHLMRQLVGSDGQTLQASSSSSNGLAWASTGAGIVRIETNNITVGNQTNINVSAQNATVYATNNAASNKIDLLIVASTNNPVEATGVQWITNQIYYVPQEFNGSNGTAATQTNMWDMSQKTFKAVTNFMGCSNTFIVTNVQQSSALISSFIGLGAVGTLSTNNVFVQAAAGVNIKWMNWATNTDGTATDIKVRAGYTYVVQMWADRATNVEAWVSTDDPYNPLSIVTFSAFTAGISNAVMTNAAVRAGASSSNATIGGTLYISTATVTNFNTAQFTNLASFTVPGNTLTNNGDQLIAEWTGGTQNGTNTINIGYSGATTNAISVTLSNLACIYRGGVSITRLSATSVYAVPWVTVPSQASTVSYTNTAVVITTDTGTNTPISLIVGQPNANRVNSLSNTLFKVRYEPASK